MIIIYLGGIGSGKTLGCIKDIVDNKQYAITNFPMQHYDNYKRIKVCDIIRREEETENKKKPLTVNWKYWNDLVSENKNFSIYLDEVHNIIHSRRSMSTTNILMSKWVSQIRKILSDSPRNHLFLISQTIRKIDVDFRELAHIIVNCSRIVTKKGKLLLKQEYFSSLDNYLINRRSFSRIYSPLQYYKYYDYKKVVCFDEGEEYL